MRRRFVGVLACALLALATLATSARSNQPRPYKGAFDFTVFDVQPAGNEFIVTASLSGEETHLGRFAGVVIYYVDVPTNTFSGTLCKQAANGDLLFETLTGEFTATGSVGDFEMTGGTGRFLGASGGGTYVGAWTNPQHTAGHVTFSGTIDY